MDYDRQTLSLFTEIDTAPAPQSGAVAQCVRQVAPLVEQKGDWAALMMLMRERGHQLSYSDVVRLVREHAPHAPQPTRQHLYSAEWQPRRPFPDWQPEGVRYEKYRRHYLIAQAAAAVLG